MNVNFAQLAHKGQFYLKKHSPEILLGLGIAGGVTAAVMAAKASMQLESTMKVYNDALNSVSVRTEEALVKATTDEQFAAIESIDKSTKLKIHLASGLQIAKLYGPAVSLGVLSIGAILASHGVMAKRQTSLIAAYGVLAKAYDSYRARVREELGDETDLNYHLGIREEVVTAKEVGEDGKKVKTKKTVKKYNDTFYGPYSFLFDEASIQWQNNPLSNQTFLVAQQTYWNQRLDTYGHVFLNEILDNIGIPRTQEGSLIGWVKSKNENDDVGDRYIDFGIYDKTTQAGRDFLEGYNPSIILDFNCDPGVIWNKI